MNNLIIIRVKGMFKNEDLKRYRQEKLKEIEQGLLVIDDTVETVKSVNVYKLGVDLKEEV